MVQYQPKAAKARYHPRFNKPRIIRYYFRRYAQCILRLELLKKIYHSSSQRILNLNTCGNSNVIFPKSGKKGKVEISVLKK